MAVLLLVPAYTPFWIDAIQFLVVYGILLFISVFALARWAPASLEARLQPLTSQNQPKADRVISPLLFLLIIAWFIFMPIENFILQLFEYVSLPMSILGAILFFGGYVILMASLFQNEFSVHIVRHQPERSHILVEKGLYRYIRHPSYFGLIFCLIGIALWLSSYANVILLPILIAILAARIIVEEKTLQETLPGYKEYMQKVPHRLIPFIW